MNTVPNPIGRSTDPSKTRATAIQDNLHLLRARAAALQAATQKTMTDITSGKPENRSLAQLVARAKQVFETADAIRAHLPAHRGAVSSLALNLVREGSSNNLDPLGADASSSTCSSTSSTRTE